MEERCILEPNAPRKENFRPLLLALHSTDNINALQSRGSIAKLPQFLLVKLNNATHRDNLSALSTCPINNISYGVSDVEVGIFIATASVEAPAAALVAATRVE